jgi:DNA repair protein RadC
MGISDWPEGERPREKLLERGAGALTDPSSWRSSCAPGCAGKSAVDLARELLAEFRGLHGLFSARTSASFCAGKGLGRAKYAQLRAVLEMSRRYLGGARRGDVLSSPEATRAYLKTCCAVTRERSSPASFSTTATGSSATRSLFQGTIDGASVHPREVVRRALLLNAAAVIFAHNHPSGVAEPSQADLRITQRLKDALALVEMRVLDHVIVGEGEGPRSPSGG